ncbi:MAG: A/G-specific adenine glycosylase, partial [Elusimicrobia bacterium]|nr:A/G-specific adenine glycosylase [Elusimicrobiota bacterium]
MRQQHHLFRTKLLYWYYKHRRKLPWRRTKDPYAIWISEIMLQQTQVATVLPYYTRFLKRFPDLPSLARAPSKEVLSHWAGLGYYSRARNLHRAAQEVIEKWKGRFPSDFENIHSLPGIGRYTAGAIISIAWNKPYPVLDGNVARVFSRLFLIRANLKDQPIQKKLWEWAQKMLEKNHPGDWNQALMELGATVCIPDSPLCSSCPVVKFCMAYRKGVQESLPNLGKSREPVSLSWNAVVLEQQGKLLLEFRKDEKLLKNHWGLPSKGSLRFEASTLGLSGAPAGTRSTAKGVRSSKLLGTIHHTITHHKIKMTVYKANLRSHN